MKYTIGTDPEIFLVNKDTGKVDSIIGLLGGSKDEPLAIEHGVSVQEDNILAEFNIPPVKEMKDFIGLINYAKDYISVIGAANNLKLHYSSSEMVDTEVLDRHENARIFGCSPSVNILTETISEIDFIPEELINMRTSGFHIHIGYKDADNDNRTRMVMCFEMMASLPLAIYDNDEHHRRELYGKFGDCRFKDYGVECRSLGGYFLKDNDTLEKVWKGVQNTLSLYESDLDTKELREMVEYCVGENDVPNHKNIMQVTKDLAKTTSLITI